MLGDESVNPMQPFNLWKSLAVLLLVALSLCGTWTWRYSFGVDAGVKAERLVWQARWSERDAADANERSARERAERELEVRRRAEMEQLARDANEKLKKANADAANAAAVANGLQLRIAEFKRKLASSQAGGTSGIPVGSNPASSASDLLADMLSESIQRNGELAAYADRARLAGMACEQAYKTTTGN